MSGVGVTRSESSASVQWVSAHACWVPPGVAVTIAGHHIRAGMLYVGHSLPAAQGERTEPALIDAELPLDPVPGTDDLGYWPAYDTIKPAQRSRYLHWLADGRRDPHVPIGYVFLFFYGLERRVLHDNETDVAAMRAEVRRLLDVYGGHKSVRRYASEFANLLDLIDGRNPAVPGLSDCAWPPPMSLRLGLSEHAARRLPAPWALAWAWYHPEITLRAPARRCWPEFAELFTLRYGDGVQIPSNGQPVRVAYRPASAGLQPTTYERAGSCDAFLADEPVRELRALVDSVTAELEPHSRWIQRHPHDRDTIAADAWLPADLLGTRRSVQPFRHWASEQLGRAGHAVVAADEMRSLWPGAHLAVVVELLGKLGIGIEPDPPGETAVLFGGDSTRPSEEYAVARAVADLAAGGIDADDLSAGLGLPDADRTRLRARMHWLAHGGQPGQRFRSLSDRQRATAGDLLLAHTSWSLDPGTMANLIKAFGRLGLDPDSVASRLHQLLTARPTPADAPVVVQSGSVAADDFALPSRDAVPLDRATIKAKLAESADVSAILERLLADEEPVQERALVAGFDAAHTTLLRRLADRQIWSYDDFARLADESGLLPEAALDALNEAALEALDEPLIQGDAKLEIATDVLEGLLT